MANSDEDRVAEAAIRKCYAGWAETYARDYYSERAPYPPIHREMIRRSLIEFGARNVLDAGCGPASILEGLADLGIDLYGFDLTPEMVAAARRKFEGLGLPADRVWIGDALDPRAFRHPSAERFDAALCVGVLPHIPMGREIEVFANLRNAVRPGGMVVVEARNALFSLFSFNRYTRAFLHDRLIDVSSIQPEDESEAERLSSALSAVDERLRLDLPPFRDGSKDAPGYDQVLSNAHNPLELRETFAESGFTSVKTLFYHFHRLPPLCEAIAPNLFRRTSLEMENNPTDWRGHFMASAFLLLGIAR